MFNLSRDEWIEMWKAIKFIEYQKKRKLPALKADIDLIKNKIQSIIGQME